MILKTSTITVKKLGHWKQDCPKKDYVVALVQNNSSSKRDLVLAIGEQLQQNFKQWVLDLGCSYHMCPYRHCFVTYEKKSSGNVHIGNDAPCKFGSIGFVQIRMHDGVARTLTEFFSCSRA